MKKLGQRGEKKQMKRFFKCFMMTMMICFVMTGIVCATDSQRYQLYREFVFENKYSVTVNSGFVEIMIGKMNFTQTQLDEIEITPRPDGIKEDIFGNKYAVYKINNFAPGQQLKVTIKRDCEVFTYEEKIPEDTNAEVIAENEIYLLPQERVESNDIRIKTKAEELTNGIHSDYLKARKIFEFVNMNIEYDVSEEYANRGALSALETRRGVCEEYANLFAALCRAVDIPARIVEGYKLDEDDLKRIYSGCKV